MDKTTEPRMTENDLIRLSKAESMSFMADSVRAWLRAGWVELMGAGAARTVRLTQAGKARILRGASDWNGVSSVDSRLVEIQNRYRAEVM